MSEELWRMTAHEAHEGLRARAFTSVELTESVLQRVADVEPRVHAYITLSADLALEQAREADAKFESGTATPLTGIPVGVKDVIVTKGVRTTAGSRILENFIPPYSSHVYEQLRRSGAVMVGKTNMDEFAMGSSTEHSAYGASHNPWNLELVPGGSSGGSAAAVSAGECLLAHGSDTGGSIRQPAALCGNVGLDPTYGRVSRFGIVAFGSSLDQVGPIGRDVEDVATMLDCISGHDPRDSTSNPEPVPDVRHYLGRDGSDVVWDFIRLAMLSVGHTAIVPFQDILTLDSGARLNTPGLATGNWSWRVRLDAFHPNLSTRLRGLVELGHRLPQGPNKCCLLYTSDAAAE